MTIVGKEDKRAFTIMVGVSMSDQALPFQTMYVGKTSGSLRVHSLKSTSPADKAPRDLVNFSGDEDEGVGGFSMRTRMVQGAF